MKDIVYIVDILLAIVASVCVTSNLIMQNFGVAWLWLIPVVILLFNILSLFESIKENKE